MSANPTLPTLDARLSKIDDLLGKLTNQMFALGVRQSAVATQLATIISDQQAASDALFLLQAEADIPPSKTLPLYQPLLVGPTTQVVAASLGNFLQLDNIVFYNGMITWTTVPTGGSAWYLTAPGNIYSRSSAYSPSTWGYLYNGSVGLTSEFRGQIAVADNKIGTLTQGWGSGTGPGSWVGGGLVGSGSNLTFQGWYFC